MRTCLSASVSLIQLAALAMVSSPALGQVQTPVSAPAELIAPFMDVSGLQHNIFKGFLALRPRLMAAGSGAARFQHFVYNKQSSIKLRPLQKAL